MPGVTTLRVSSHDDPDRVSNTQFTVSMSKRSLFNVERASPVFVSFANVFDNVTIYHDTRFTFVTDTVATFTNAPTTTTFDVPTGRYTGTTLAAYITANSPDLDCKVNAVNAFKFDFTATSAVLYVGLYPTDTPPNTPDMYNLLGLTAANQVAIAPLGTTTATNPMNLFGPTTAFLYVRQLNEDFIDSENSGSKFNAIAAIPLGKTPYGGMVQWEPKDIEQASQYFSDERDCSALQVRLRDEDGNLLILPTINELVFVVRLYSRSM